MSTLQPLLSTPFLLPIGLAFSLGIATIIAYWDAARKTVKPAIQLPEGPASKFHESVLQKCRTLLEPVKPVPFLTNGHVETIFAAKFRQSPYLEYERECLIMEDAGCIALDWIHLGKGEQELPADAPILILMAGLTGGSGDSYVLHAVAHAKEYGIRAVVCNGRGTADSPVTTPQYYSASYTGDVRSAINHIHKSYPKSTLLAAGWSLGANILIKYLDEEGEATPLTAAVSMVNPFDLTISNENFGKGFNRIYDWNLTASLRRIMRRHGSIWNRARGKFRPADGMSARTIKEFDDAITIHSFGWESVSKYYAASSSSKSIPRVKIPLLCLQALDDPIAPKEAIPYEALRSNPFCVLATTTCGGHLGWVHNSASAVDAPWSNGAMMEWLCGVMDVVKGKSAASLLSGAEDAQEGVKSSVPA